MTLNIFCKLQRVVRRTVPCAICYWLIHLLQSYTESMCAIKEKHVRKSFFIQQSPDHFVLCTQQRTKF